VSVGAPADTLLEAALSYARRAWPVFPLHTPGGRRCSCGKPACRDVGKHPRTPNGLLDATTDETQVHRWWRQEHEANIGLRTGPESGILVVDAEVGAGLDVLQAWQEENGLLPPTPMVRTGGGGAHIYLAYPASGTIRNSVKKIAPSIDIRGAGGYVVAPPSQHESRDHYAWLDELRMPAPAPPWLLAKIAAVSGGRTVTTGGRGDDGAPIPEGGAMTRSRRSPVACGGPA
jgi:putative DNA primase/helicase